MAGGFSPAFHCTGVVAVEVLLSAVTWFHISPLTGNPILCISRVSKRLPCPPGGRACRFNFGFSYSSPPFSDVLLFDLTFVIHPKLPGDF